MKLEMKTLAAGPKGVFPAGKKCDVPEPLAMQFQEFWAGGSMGPLVKPPDEKKSAAKKPPAD